MNNKQIADFEQGLVNYINSVNVPIEVKRLVMFELYEQMKTLSNRQIEIEEKQAMEQANNQPADQEEVSE